MQWEGDLAEPVPQLGLWKPGQTPILCEPPQEESLAMKGYAGSVAATPDRILVTSPKGGVAMVFPPMEPTSTPTTGQISMARRAT
jgi:hypothetical protein